MLINDNLGCEKNFNNKHKPKDCVRDLSLFRQLFHHHRQLHESAN